MGIRGRHAATGFAAGLACVLAMVVSGCAAPQYTYIADSSGNTYFKVPYGWHKIDGGMLALALHTTSAGLGGGAWDVGYDGSHVPSASHVLDPATSQPFVLAVVAPLNPSTAESMSYNSLRDFLLPVTASSRQAAAAAGFPLTGFHLVSDSVVMASQGVHGVQDVFDYTYPGGTADTFDQVALTNADDTEVYLLVVHCLATCYAQYRDQIDSVATSFTVRSP